MEAKVLFTSLFIFSAFMFGNSVAVKVCSKFYSEDTGLSPSIPASSVFVFQLVGGYNSDLFIGCQINSYCRGYFDRNKATNFEAIYDSGSRYYLIKTPDGGCLTYSGAMNPQSTGHAYASSDCKPNNNNLWKNDLGQIYNKDGRALWWSGDNSI